MTSDQSVTSTSSRVRQFGLYRTIDARTEEFLKLSRKRQIRQGCACAAVSTAITVTIIVAVLLIYEYAIAVDTNLRHSRESMRSTINENAMKNLEPMADRLDRSYFGFDQDYYSKMPLLVNAMAENVHTEPASETTTIRQLQDRPDIVYKSQKRSDIYSIIRRTTPGPFQFNQKSSTPHPFGKTFGTKNWIESYRNAQRMKNLQQILIYLGKTFNAKLGDMYTMPTQTHVAFSGIYLEPLNNKRMTGTQKTIEQPRHRFDPLFTFKPDSPSDVNLLADDILRFSPNFNELDNSHTLNLDGNIDKYPTNLRNAKFNYSNNLDNAEMLDLSIQDLFRQTTLDPLNHRIPSTPQHLRKIYITTTRPTLQFKPRSSIPITRSYFRHEKSRLLPTTVKANKVRNPKESTTDATTIIHLNVFPTQTIIKTNVPVKMENTTPILNTRNPNEQIPIINANEVEDYHAGSSGIIPVTTPMQPTTPQVTSMSPFLDTTMTLAQPTRPSSSDIIKFSREDAKIPDQYLTMTTFEETTKMTTTEKIQSINDKNLQRDDNNINTEARTLVIKLLNNFETITQNIKDASNSTDVVDDIITNTYIPQINGHHRNIEHNSQKIFELLKENSEKYRRNRLKTLTTVRSPTYVPMYVEIKRNRTRNLTESEVK